MLSQRSLTTAIALLFVLLIAACGGTSATSQTGAEAESEAESESESEAEGEAESEAEAESESEGESESEAESESESEGGCAPEDCDDGVVCTDDAWDEEECECVNEPDHAYCFLNEGEGTVCDAMLDCTEPETICSEKADCPDLLGGCLVGACSLVSNTCVYAPLDTDGDGYAAQACDEIGGNDCDNSNALIYPGAPEICDGLDNDCDSETDGFTQVCCTGGDTCADGESVCTAGEWGSCIGGGSESESESESECGDGVCELIAGESEKSCAVDCTRVCGDGYCGQDTWAESEFCGWSPVSGDSGGCAEDCDCSGSDTCSEAWDCVDSCSDDACRIACMNEASPEEQSWFGELVECVFFLCTGECYGSATSCRECACTFCLSDLQNCAQCIGSAACGC